jgi:beta-N-acetylhexosaminidase
MNEILYKKIILYTIVSLVCLVASGQLRSPLFYKIRGFDLLILVSSSLIILLSIQKYFSTKRRLSLFIPTVFMSTATLVICLYTELRFHYIKHQVLHADTQKLQHLGKHIILGYSSESEIRKLVSIGGVGGIFLTARNVKNKTDLSIQEFLTSLQEIQKANQLDTLFVTTDQEGGDVSRLTPPLKQFPYISEAYEKNGLASVKELAIEKAKALVKLGVNVNFSPVVDLKKVPQNLKIDLHSRIWERAISEDPIVVAQVAQVYSEYLSKNGVIPVLKHFPGLGHIEKDTHFFTADIHTQLEDYLSKDFLPFQEIYRQNPSVWFMLGHVRLLSIDKEYPASFSQKIVNEFLRKEQNIQATLITDDFCMGPTYYYKDGVGMAAKLSLDAGIDYILISYNPDIYYYVMYDLIYN